MTRAKVVHTKQPPPAPPRRPLAGWLVAAAVAAVVAVVAIVAIVASGDDEADVPPGVEQTRPVTIAGDTLPRYSSSGSDAAVGLPAPTVRGSSFDGAPLTIEPGAPTLVVFLAHWCSHCQREVPVLTEWEASGDVPAGVEVIGVATGTSRGQPNFPPSAWLDREDFPFPVIADSERYETAEAFGLSGYPYFVVLDSRGTVVARASGEVDPAVLTDVLTGVD